MALRHSLTYVMFLPLSAAALAGQSGAPMVQPGAPGKMNTTLSPETVINPQRAPSAGDISFMQGMIMHHSQAVEMTELLRARTHNKALLALGNRISISQTDEIKYMKQWLTDRGQPVDGGMDHMHHMAGMKPGMKMDMSSMAMMPGMLTPQQMTALRNATGRTFDHLFLTGMIQHHTGALIMVKELFDTPGTGQDNVLFDFATDVDNTQRAEIEIMRGMLKEKS